MSVQERVAVQSLPSRLSALGFDGGSRIFKVHSLEILRLIVSGSGRIGLQAVCTY